MSDERFDEAIRDALLADDPGAVPVRLRSRMAMIPDETPAAPPTAPSPWRARLSRYGVPMGVLAAAAIIVVVFGSIALRAQQVATVIPSVPSVVPSVGPSVAASATPSAVSTPGSSEAPSAATGSSAPESLAATPPPTGPISLDPGKLTGLHDGTFAISGTRAFWRGVSDTVSEPLLGWLDLVDSSKGGVLVDLKNGHDIGAHALTEAGVVWIETWFTDKPIDCSGTTGCGIHQGQPVSWALNLTTLDGKTTRLDAGVVSRIDVEGEGASATPPTMSAQSNRVAYAVPHVSRVLGHPEESEIIVRSLADGAVVRTVSTSGYVSQLGVDGQLLAYGIAKDDGVHTGADPSNATLMLLKSDAQGVPEVVAQHVQQLAVGDGGTGSVRFAWTTSQPDDGMLHASTADRSSHSDLAPSGAGMGNGYWPQIVGDGYVWFAQQQDAQGAWSTVVLAWHPAWTAARVVSTLGSPDWIGSSGDRLLFGGAEVPVLKTMGGGSATPPAAMISAADLFGN